MADGGRMTAAQVDQLFADHSAGEVREMVKRMRQGMEGKREELRLMVGRRYRDIIEATDELHKMQQVGRGSLAQLDRLRAVVDWLLQYSYADLARGTPPTGAAPDGPIAAFMSDLCDVLCSFIAGRQWSAVAWTFPLLLHVHGATGVNRLVSQFWREIYDNRLELAKQCLSCLSLDDDADAVCSILACIVSLDGRPQGDNGGLDRVPKMFFNQCLLHLERLLNTGVEEMGTSRRIGLFIDKWFKAVTLARDVFLGTFSQPSKLVAHLQAVKTCPPDVVAKYIAVQRKAVRDALRCLLASCQTTALGVLGKDVSVEVVRQETSEFCEKSMQLYADATMGALQNCHTLDSLLKRQRGVQEALNACVVKEGWQRVAEDLFYDIPVGKILHAFDQPVSSRAIQLMQQMISTVFASVFAVDERRELESSMTAMWKERPVQSDQQQVALCMLGVPREAISKCRLVDKEYKVILDALDKFCPDHRHHMQKEDAEKEPNCLQKLIVDSTVRVVEDLCAGVKTAMDGRDLTELMFWAKLGQSLLVGCDHLKAVFFFKGKYSLAWQRLIAALNQMSDDLFARCVRSAGERLCAGQARRIAQRQVQPESRLRTLRGWQPLEHGGKSCGLSVPVNLSTWTFQLLLDMSATFARFGSHTMSRSFVEAFVEQVMGAVLDGYDEALQGDLNDQRVILQLLFDLDVLAVLLLTDWTAELKARQRRLTVDLRRRVDAFDLELMTGSLKENALRQAFRLATLVGNIVPDGQAVTRQTAGVKCQPAEEAYRGGIHAPAASRPIHFARIGVRQP